MFDLLCCKSWTLLEYCFTLVDYFKSHCFSTNQTSSLNIFALLQFLHCCLRLTALKTNNHSRVTFVCILYFSFRMLRVFTTHANSGFYRYSRGLSLIPVFYLRLLSHISLLYCFIRFCVLSAPFVRVRYPCPP